MSGQKPLGVGNVLRSGREADLSRPARPVQLPCLRAHPSPARPSSSTAAPGSGTGLRKVVIAAPHTFS